MKIGIAVLAIVIGAFAHGFAQDPPAEVVKISTNLIQLDATVTDSKGNVIRDLTRDDFEIFENGRKQAVSGFSFVSHAAKKTTTTSSPSQTGPVVAPVPPSEVRPDRVRRAVALVVDDLSLSYESMNKTRRSLKKFVEEQMSEGDLVAIIRVGTGMGALQQFTSDKRQLLANIERLKFNPQGRGRIGSFAPINDGPESLQKQDEDGDDALVKKQFQDSFGDYQESMWAQGTLGALRYVVNGLASLPGRKAVVLFSDGFQIIQRDEHGYTQMSRGKEFIKILIDMANRASVVFYTMDARGLDDGVITAQDSVYPSRPPNNPRRFQEVREARTKELFDTQDGMVYLAEETGGFPVLIQNDLNVGLEKVLEDQSYYLLAYEPTAETFDAKTSRSNNLEIKVKREGAKVRYRSGFFANAVDPAAKPVKQTQAQRLQEALTSPFVANKVGLRMNALYGNNTGGDFVTAFLHIDTRDLKFVDADGGMKKASLDVLAVTYGENGVAVDKIARRFELPVKQDDYERMLKQGYVFFFNFPIKKPGPYQFRVAIHDPLGDTIGSASQFVEVPDLKKKSLTLSGITLENFSAEDWQRMSSGMQKVSDKKESGVVTSGDLMSDTSLRRFHRGTVLHYSFDVYNAQSQQNVTTRLRVFRDGDLLLDGKPIPVDASGRTSTGSVRSNGAMSLPANMAPGDYILQIVVTDGSNKRVATQYVQFELL
ncbi:MAG TPA: VWA domain-containing protein [Pyrinomonadaceae bacterium]|nr:VWA domain-containing protein [Pyrinomonadaceae bacterium]